MGKRTSVYLSDDLAAAVAESGVPLAELICRGLAGTVALLPGRPEPPGETRAEGAPHATPAATATPMRPGARQATEPGQQRPTRARCPHPGTRMIGGWCRQCGVVVEPGGYLPG